MRTVIRVAAWLSVAATLVTVLVFVAGVEAGNEWDQRGDDTSAWVGVLYGLLASLVPLSFIWLGVFVVYVVARIPERET